MNNSLERIIPDYAQASSPEEKASLELHMQRYEFAGKHLKPGIVYDVACGVGYGSYFLSTTYEQEITKLFAVDIDKKSIDYAQERYQHQKIEFCNEDAFVFQQHEKPDTIISIETIEHLSEPAQFVQRLASQLKEGGRFIASAPVTPSMDANPFHLQDFTVTSFKKLFQDAGLKEITCELQHQPYGLNQLFRNKNSNKRAIRRNLIQYYLQHPFKLLLRIKSTITDGLVNKYLLVVYEKS